MSYWNAFAKKYPKVPLVRIDAGSIFSRGDATSLTANKYILEGTYRSGLNAILLSAWDLPVWQELGDLAAAGIVSGEFLKVPLVSANVTANVPHFPVLQRYIVKEEAVDPRGGKPLRVGITGILADPERLISRKDFQIQAPQEAARRVVAELHDRADFLILVTDMSLGEAINLAVTVPGISMIAVSHNYTAPTEAQQTGDTLLVSPINEGRMITEVRLAVRSGVKAVSIGSHSVALDRAVPDDPAMADLQRRAQAEIEKIQK